MRNSIITRRYLLILLSLACLGSWQPTAAQDFKKAALAWSLPWDNDWVTAVCFVSPQRVAAGNNLGQILIWNLPGKNDPAPPPILRLDGHTNTINRLLVTPDGRWLISASSDHTIRYWDMQASPKRSETLVLNAGAIAEAKSRKRKVPSPIETQVEVCEAARVLEGHQDWVLGLSLTRDGNTLVSGDDKGTVIVWDRPAGKELRRWQLKGWAWALAVAPDADGLLISERIPLVFDSGRYTAVKLWDPRTGELKKDLSKDFSKQMIAAAAYSPDGKYLVLGRGGEVDGNNGKVTLLDPATGKKLKELSPGHQLGITDLVFHPDGKHLISSGRDTLVRIWNVADGKMVKELGQSRGGQFKDWIHAVSVSPDGRYLAAADMAGQVQIYALHGKEGK